MQYAIFFVAGAFLILVYRIVREIWYTQTCVEDHTLRDFMYGRTKRRPELHRRIAGHLSQCETCRERLRHIQRGKPLEDHLVED